MIARIASLTAWLLCGAIIAAILLELARELVNGGFQGEPLELVRALVESLIPIPFALVGSLILSRQSRNVIGWLLILPALAFAAIAVTAPAIAGVTTPPESPSLWVYLALYVSGVSWVFLIFPLFLIALLFPTGKVLSPRWRWAVVLAIGMVVFFLIVAALVARIGPVGEQSSWTITNPIGFITQDTFDVIFNLPWGIGLATLTLLSVVALALRYRRATPTERQQLKWLLFAIGFFAAAYIPAVLTEGELEGVGRTILDFLFIVSILTFPIAIGIAIMRYRLYDIDIIIRKTLVYSVLTGLLALIYFGGVMLVQQLTRSITASSDLAIVVSTLVIAALFFPLRRRVQNAIDRRFYRRKYDAAKTLSAFSTTVRDEVELEKLTAELLNVVNETMQPASVSVWLKPTTDRTRQIAEGKQ